MPAETRNHVFVAASTVSLRTLGSTSLDGDVAAEAVTRLSLFRASTLT